MIRQNTGGRAWVLVQHKMGRLLTFTTGRYAVEPTGHTVLDPGLQEIYALTPLDTTTEGGIDTRTSDWMRANGVGLGPVHGTPVTVGGQTWTLHRAVKLGEGGGGQTQPAATQPGG